MSLLSSNSSLINPDASTSFAIYIRCDQTEKSNSTSSDDTKPFYEQSSFIPNAQTHSNSLSNDYYQEKGLNNNDQDIKLLKQTNTMFDSNQTTQKSIKEQHSTQSTIDKQSKKINTNMMDKLIEQDTTVNRSSETSEIVIFTTAARINDLLSYQDVLNAIEREYHLHAGQEREIIMKLWLKEQTMISILQRFRYLLQDLNIDDKDFVGALKRIREMINYANRDVHYLREHTTMLENENHFLENEFQRQLDRIIEEKNEQISRLTHIIDQTYSTSNQHKDNVNNEEYSTGNEELLKKFMQQNVELQRELETLRAKLEYTFTLVNEKLNEQKASATTSSISIVQTAFEQMRQTEMKLQELKLKLASQQEENDLLKYLIEKSQQTTNIEPTELLNIIEQRTLERELNHVRHRLEITQKKTVQFEQQFENSDEIIKFHIEKLKLKCDVLNKHIALCNERLDDIHQKPPIEYKNENLIQKTINQQYKSNNEQKVIQLENELSKLRERYNEIVEHSHTLKYELNNARKQLHDREKLESNSSTDLDQERRRANQFDIELKSLKKKYEDVCERVNVTTHQLEQSSRRCEQLEKERLEINAQSEHLSQNVVNMTSKYKDKLNTIKSRLEQTEYEKREIQNRYEQFQNEIERLKNELIHKKEIIFEKDKIIQDAHYKNREILLDRQSVEERITNECKRLNELMEKNHHLEEELDRMRRNQLSDSINLQRVEFMNYDSNTNDSSKGIEELKLKIDEIEQRFKDEKTSKESLQIQIKILEEENADLRDVMIQMRKRVQDGGKEERDRNDEIQQLIARAELNARQYMTNLSPSSSTLIKILSESQTTNTL